MAAQQGDCENSHVYFESLAGPDGSPVRVNRRRRSDDGDGDDDGDDDGEVTIETEGYNGSREPQSPFGNTTLGYVAPLCACCIILPVLY